MTTDLSTSAAVIASLACWAALAGRQAACDAPRFVLEDDPGKIVDAVSFARQLASAPKPLRIRATDEVVPDGPVFVRLMSGASDERAAYAVREPSASLAASLFADAGIELKNILVLAGARRAVLSWDAMVRYEMDYWLDMPTSYSLDLVDASIASLHIPREWCSTAEAVALFGSFSAHGSTSAFCIQGNEVVS